MLLRRFGTFTGGIDLPDDKDATLQAPIRPVAGLRRLRVPLAPAPGGSARAVVRPGDLVRAGQRLAEADRDAQVDVFAPLAGRVAGPAEAMLPAGASGWRRCEAIELTDLAEREPLRRLPVIFEWQAADEHSLRLRIAEGGLLTFRPPVEPVARWIASARRAGVETLVANVMENTPFITADHRLLAERGREVVRGLAILARAMAVKDVMLAVDRRRTDAYRSAVRAAKNYGVQPIALSHKYPVGADAVLVEVLTRREAPPSPAATATGAEEAPRSPPLTVGVAVTDAATCWATYRWVACGERATARVVTVSGPRVGAPANLLVPFGAGAEEVLGLAKIEGDGPAVYGSAMDGRQLADGAVVDSRTNGLLGLRPPEIGQPTPCIRCGWCSQQCPARLNVAMLNDDFELGRIEHARRGGALACVSCGICSYVCPARLPLAERLLLLKQAIRQADAAEAAQAKAGANR